MIIRNMLRDIMENQAMLMRSDNILTERIMHIEEEVEALKKRGNSSGSLRSNPYMKISTK